MTERFERDSPAIIGFRLNAYRGKGPTMSYLSLNDVRAEALFASTMQPSDEPTATQVRTEIMHMVRQLGTRGCAARMAQEFGNAPESAVSRMRWARRVVADVFAVRPAHTALAGVGAGRSAA